MRLVWAIDSIVVVGATVCVAVDHLVILAAPAFTRAVEGTQDFLDAVVDRFYHYLETALAHTHIRSVDIFARAINVPFVL